MEKCYFNTCPLNDAESLKQYKKATKSDDYLFIKLSKDDEIIQQIKANGKKFSFCKEHYNRLCKLSQIKAFLEKEHNLKSHKEESIKNLSDLNNLIRYDISFRYIASQMEIKDPLKSLSTITLLDHLLSLLNNPPILTKEIELYLLLIISIFFKEIQISKSYAKQEIFDQFIEYLLSLNYSMNYDESFRTDLSDNKYNDILNRSLQYELTMNIIQNFLINAKINTISQESIVKIIENTMKVIGEITICYDILPKAFKGDQNLQEKYTKLRNIINNETFNATLSLLHGFFISKNKQIDLIEFLISFILKCFERLISFCQFIGDKNTHCSFIIFIYDVLNGIGLIAINDVYAEQLEGFSKGLKKYFEDKNGFPLYEQCLKLIDGVNEKVTGFKNTQKFMKNMEEEKKIKEEKKDDK